MTPSRQFMTRWRWDADGLHAEDALAERPPTGTTAPAVAGSTHTTAIGPAV